MGLYAAWAFAKTGRNDLAVKALHSVLRFGFTDDEAFSLLNDTEGAPALSFYDELSRIDRWSPRPVAWKADLLRRLGRLDEAEKLARQAVGCTDH